MDLIIIPWPWMKRLVLLTSKLISLPKKKKKSNFPHSRADVSGYISDGCGWRERESARERSRCVSLSVSPLWSFISPLRLHDCISSVQLLNQICSAGQTQSYRAAWPDTSSVSTCLMKLTASNWLNTDDVSVCTVPTLMMALWMIFCCCCCSAILWTFWYCTQSNGPQSGHLACLLVQVVWKSFFVCFHLEFHGDPVGWQLELWL